MLVLVLLSIVLTAAYCAAAWLGLAVYLTWLPLTIANDLSPFWRVLFGLSLPFPWHALLWQAPAVASMVWVLLGVRSGAESGAWPLDRRLLVHVIATTILICLIVVAMIVPLVEIVQALKR